MLNAILKLFTGAKKVSLQYPSHFIIITYSQPTLEDGIECDENKIIERHFINKYGRHQVERKYYSEELLETLQDTYNIPVHDRTRKPIKYPVHSRIEPSTIKYMQK